MQKQFFIPTPLKYILLFSLLTGFLIPASSTAQMFSVGEAEDDQPRTLQSYVIVGLSLEAADFVYTGEGLEDYNRADFNSQIIRLRLNSPGLHINIGAGGTFTGMDNTSYFSAGAMLYNDFAFVRRPQIQVGIPIQISTELKQAQNNDGDREFQQSSFLFGTGVYTQLKVGSKTDFSVRVTPNYGFSYSQGSLFGGNLFKMMASARFDIADVFGQNAFSIGYDFDFRKYNLDENLDNYDYTSHALTLGIGF